MVLIYKKSRSEVGLNVEKVKRIFNMIFLNFIFERLNNKDKCIGISR
jgi:hypothetical protein